MNSTPSPEFMQSLQASRRRTAQFATCPHELIDHPEAGALEISLYTILDRWFSSGNPAYPSMETLSNRMSRASKPVSVKAVQGAKKRLIDLGFLIQKRRGNGKTNLYFLDDQPSSPMPQKLLDHRFKTQEKLLKQSEETNSTVLDRSISTSLDRTNSTVLDRSISTGYKEQVIHKEKDYKELADSRVQEINKLIEILTSSPSSKRKIKPSKNWVKDFDDLMRLGPLGCEQCELSFEEVEKVLVWSLNDEFWGNQIRSPKNLRKKFARLESQMEARKKTKKTFSVDFDLAARMDWDAGWIAQRDLATGTVVRKSNDWRMMNADSARIKFFAEAKKLTEEDLEATRRWLEI